LQQLQPPNHNLSNNKSQQENPDNGSSRNSDCR
jgi:hypothetical protein